MAVPSASGSGIVNKGTTYGASSQVTSTNINAHVDDAVFNANAVDGTTINADDNGKNLFVVDASISSAKLASSSVSGVKIVDGAVSAAKLSNASVTSAKIVDSNVTLAKIADIADDRVLGNISGSSAAPSELTAANLITLLGTNLINPASGIDDDTNSITLSNGLIVKFDTFTSSSGVTTTVTFPASFTTCYGVLAMPNFSGATVASSQTHYVRQVTASNFVFYSNSASTNNFYIAIGR